MELQMNVKLIFVLLAVLCCTVNAADPVDVLPSTEPGESDKMGAQDQVGCKMDICFAIEGSDMITRSQFNLEREFVSNLVNAIDNISNKNQVRFAAVQYGIANDLISFLTSNVPRFLRELNRTSFIRATSNFVAGGIVFCHRDLLPTPDTNSVTILIGTGRSTFGSDPVFVAEQFRQDGGEILSVGVGRSDRDALLGIAGERGNRFFVSNRNIDRVVDRVSRKLCSQ